MNAIISLVVARAENGVIGNQGGMPWRIPEDMKHFKAITRGKPCIMGRKTWESLPKKPLPGRTNIIVTRDHGFRADGAVIAHSFEEALDRARDRPPHEIAVIGGAEIYRVALPHAHRIHLTEIHETFDGDVLMPPLEEAGWREIWRADHPAAAGVPAFSFVILDRNQ